MNINKQHSKLKSWYNKMSNASYTKPLTASRTFMNKVTLFLFFLLLTIRLLAQENFIQGSIINNAGDTIEGLIDYRNWKNNPTIVYFKKGRETSKVVLTPHSVRGFIVNNERYVSAGIEIEISPSDISKLSFEPGFNTINDTVFLLTLMEGDKSLFAYSNNSWKPQYYIFLDGKPELLKYKRYLKQVDNADVIIYNNMFQGQLMLYLSDCGELKKAITQSHYTAESLLTLIKKYYQCTGRQSTYIKKKDKVKIEFGMFAGATITQPVFNSSKSVIYSELGYTDFSISYNGTAGLFLSYCLKRNQQRLSLNLEQSITNFNSTGEYSYHKSSYDYGTFNSSIGYLEINTNFLVRYKYPVNKAFIFLNVGASMGTIFGINSNKQLSETYYYGITKQDTSSVIPYTRYSEQGLLFGAGVIYKKFSFETRYEISNGFVSLNTLTMNIRRFFFVLGYRFF